MKKVYLVTSGEYSDYSVNAVFTTKELAQKFIDSFEKTGFNRFNKIETYSLNPFEFELKENYKPYFLRMTKEGEAYDIQIKDSSYGFSEPIGHSFDWKNHNMYIHCFAKDEQHAIKICNEKRVQLIANDKWPKK